MDLTNKKINFLGDSITEGAGVKNIENRFDNILKRISGLKIVRNYGVGGSRLAKQYSPSEIPKYDLDFALRAEEMDKDADIIVVYGGVNDYLHGDAPFGEEGNKTKDTFTGAVYNLSSLLISLYPHSPIVFFTPAHTYGDQNISLYKKEKNMSNGKPLAEYTRVIKEVAPTFGIHVFDMMEILPIDPNNEEDYTKYTVDGLHFNDEGHSIIAEVMKKCLESI